LGWSRRGRGWSRIKYVCFPRDVMSNRLTSPMILLHQLTHLNCLFFVEQAEIFRKPNRHFQRFPKLVHIYVSSHVKDALVISTYLVERKRNKGSSPYLELMCRLGDNLTCVQVHFYSGSSLQPWPPNLITRYAYNPAARISLPADKASIISITSLLLFAKTNISIYLYNIQTRCHS
jgi:hypothetical protein